MPPKLSPSGHATPQFGVPDEPDPVSVRRPDLGGVDRTFVCCSACAPHRSTVAGWGRCEWQKDSVCVGGGGGGARQERQPGQGTRMEGMGERAHGRQRQQRGWAGQPAPSLPGARWAVRATGAGAYQGQTNREGERDIWWTVGTTRGGAGHLGLTHTETQRGRLWTACGERRVGSKNSQTTPAMTSTTPIRQLLGAIDAQTAHHATSSTAPAHQPLGSANAETTPARAPPAAADRKQPPDATCEGKNG